MGLRGSTYVELATMTYGVGEVLGQYELIRLLGRGACGEVFLVGSGKLQYAMKVIPCDLASGSEAAVRKLRDAALAEARMMSEIRHAHIVNCVEVSFDAE